MASMGQFLNSTGHLRIEVDAATVASADYADALISSLQGIVGAFGAQISQMPKERRPTEMQVTFGLKAQDNGGFAISLDPDHSNFTVTLKWGGSEEGGLLGGLGIPTPGPA